MNFKPVKSSHIKEIGYNPEKKELYVKFLTGATYVYSDVSATQHSKLMEAPSKGIHLNTHIVPKSNYRIKSWK